VVSGKNKWLTALILVIGIAQMGVGCWLTALMFIEKSFTTLPRFKPSLSLQAGFGTAGDILIGLTLCYYLFRSRTGIGRTNQLLNTLIIWTVNTGLTMAITEVSVLITYLASPRTFVFIAIHFFVSKVYSNSLLASLNNRRRIRTSFGTTGYVSEYDVVPDQSSSSPSSGTQRRRSPKGHGQNVGDSNTETDMRSRGPQFSSALVFGTSVDVGERERDLGDIGYGHEHPYGLRSLESGERGMERRSESSKGSTESHLDTGREEDQGVRFEMVGRAE